MPKLTLEQRKTMQEEINAGKIDQKGIVEKYQVSDRQANRYIQSAGKSAPKGRPVKEEAPVEKPKAEEKTEDNEPELTKDDLLDLPKPKAEKKDDLDPNKDYCASCHRLGKIIELTKNMEQCPSCGAKLRW